MPIKFLNVPGSTNLRSSRPTGYKFPTGLSSVGSDTSVDYLVAAGGGGGGGDNQADGGGGHCFPAGHASTGFAFMAAFFGLQQSAPRAALKWLGWAVLVGFILGISQQVRGAHFMSHTLWTSWLCWTVGWIGHLVFCKLRLKVRAY
jgi:hypothetical protein